MRTLFNLLLITLLALIPDLYAETIYKITDEHGNITYTTTPPAAGVDANTINVAPEPSDERI